MHSTYVIPAALVFCTLKLHSFPTIFINISLIIYDKSVTGFLKSTSLNSDLYFVTLLWQLIFVKFAPYSVQFAIDIKNGLLSTSKETRFTEAAPKLILKPKYFLFDLAVFISEMVCTYPAMETSSEN